MPRDTYVAVALTRRGQGYGLSALKMYSFELKK